MRLALLFAIALIAVGGCSKDSKQSPSTTASAPAPGQTLELGKPRLVTAGHTYQVGEATVRVGRISMANGVDNQGREMHALMMELEVTRSGAAPVKLGLSGDDPSEAVGLVFRADALGYEWGKSPATATLRVDRK